MLSRTSIVLTSHVMIMINVLNKKLKCYNNRDLDVGQVHSFIYYYLIQLCPIKIKTTNHVHV